MYRVLGIDQREYGPVSAEVVRRWITEGRANAQTRVRPEGGEGWKPLSEVPEFAATFQAGPRPPPLPPLPSRLPPVRPPPAKNSGQAVASLILGILALPTCGITALAGLPLGILALKKIKRSQGQLGGRGLATAGLCLSGVLVLLLPITLAALMPKIAQERNQGKMVNCRNNLRQLGMAMRMYANDQSDRFALASNWCDALQGYVATSSAFECPAGRSGLRSHFGYNARLGGLEEDRINPKTVMFFEIEGGWNISGGPDRALRQPRHFLINVCYADGSTEQVPAYRLPQLRWDP
jgi:hypothetical protein